MDIDTLINEAKQAIHAQFQSGHPVVVAFSGGKDSSVVALLALLAAKDAVAAGLAPLVVVTTSDPLIEKGSTEDEAIDNASLLLHAQAPGARIDGGEVRLSPARC